MSFVPPSTQPGSRASRFSVVPASIVPETDDGSLTPPETEFEAEMVGAVREFESTPCPDGRAARPVPVESAKFLVKKADIKGGQYPNYYRTIMRGHYMAFLRRGMFDDLDKVFSVLPYLDPDYMSYDMGGIRGGLSNFKTAWRRLGRARIERELASRSLVSSMDQFADRADEEALDVLQICRDRLLERSADEFLSLQEFFKFFMRVAEEKGYFG